jgi:phosphoserine phosphatase
MNSQNNNKRLLIAFDMDGTLIDGRLVFAVAEKFGLSDKVREIQENRKLHGYEQSIIIARLFKGLSATDIIRGIESINLMKNCERVLQELKEQGHVLGIISDSYDIAANYVAENLNLDFCEANTLELDTNKKLTGSINMPLGWQKIRCYCKISVCKRYHLEKSAQKFHISPGATVAIGDTKSDLCMIENAGIGVAFMPKDKILETRAAVSIKDPDLANFLELI